jgi:hypothetical protein
MTRFISRAKLQRAIATASLIFTFVSGSRTLAQTGPDGTSGVPISRSFPSERSFTSSRSLASSYDSFANRGSTRSVEPSRTAKSSSWHLPHFSKAHLSSSSSWSQHGFFRHAPKQKHFSAPKFKAPHAPKSHSGGHSWGHSGSKSHRG